MSTSRRSFGTIFIQSSTNLFSEVVDGQTVSGHAIDPDDVESSLLDDGAADLHQERDSLEASIATNRAFFQRNA